MKFKSVCIKNFRNFKEANICLENKNVFFGMNDVGKTNFMNALRFVFDRNTRKNNLAESDFYKKQIDEDIEIVVLISLDDTENDDSKKMIACVKGEITEDYQVFITLKGKFDINEQVAIPYLYWGNSAEHLVPMKSNGTYYEIDHVINVVYIDAYVNLYNLLDRNINNLLNEIKFDDSDAIKEINQKIGSINDSISSLEKVKRLQNSITAEFKNISSQELNICLKSEFALNGLYKSLTPYILENKDEDLYPTSGEGRKKLLTYALFNLISKQKSFTKINLFLIEEPENHLHRAIQISLSKFLFLEDPYFKYIFVTTHSSNIISEINNAQLIRIYSSNEFVAKSTFYTVPKEYVNNRKMYNECLSNALFSNKVLLVEGISEKLLFEKVLSVICPHFEELGGYVLPVNGVSFTYYRKVLLELGIKVIIKTDNDLRKRNNMIEPLGINRVFDLAENKDLVVQNEIIEDTSVTSKRKLYNSYENKLKDLEKEHIYLSKCSLEEDLDEAIHDRMAELLNNDNPVKYLQNAKCINMHELINKLSDSDCRNIYCHENFACLKDFVSD